MKRFSAKIYGRVQGVFFRDTTRRYARQRNITGWVRNEPDGTVRVVAEGPEPALRELESFLHEGPSGARVERVDVEWAEVTGKFSEFGVRY